MEPTVEGASTPSPLQPPAYWENRKRILETLRCDVLVPYFDFVEKLRATSARAVDVDAIVAASYRDQ